MPGLYCALVAASLAHPLDPAPGRVVVVGARVPFDNLGQAETGQPHRGCICRVSLRRSVQVHGQDRQADLQARTGAGHNGEPVAVFGYHRRGSSRKNKALSYVRAKETRWLPSAPGIRSRVPPSDDPIPQRLGDLEDASALEGRPPNQGVLQGRPGSSAARPALCSTERIAPRWAAKRAALRNLSRLGGGVHVAVGSDPDQTCTCPSLANDSFTP